MRRPLDRHRRSSRGPSAAVNFPERPPCRELTAKLDAEKGITDNPLLADSAPEALEAAAAPDADAADAAVPVSAEANGAEPAAETGPSPEQQVQCPLQRQPGTMSSYRCWVAPCEPDCADL